MRRLAIVLLLALVVTGIAGGDRRAAADAPPVCYDFLTGQTLTATKWLPPGQPGTLVGTSGDDVLVGSDYDGDTIKGLGGNDVICSNDANAGQNRDTIDAGSGNDSVYGGGIVHGGSGNDYLAVGAGGSTGYGDSGNDHIVAYYGASADGGSGNDTIESGSFGGADQLLGGSGRDEVNNPTSANVIDCGSSIDTVQPGNAPVVKHCEHVADQ